MDDRLIDELVSPAQAEGPHLPGEDGLSDSSTTLLLESALEGAITDHLGYVRHDPAGENDGNSRNGTRSKSAPPKVGPFGITVPRNDRAFDR
ncbi:transposase [Streptomyces sp. NPDC054919]